MITEIGEFTIVEMAKVARPDGTTEMVGAGVMFQCFKELSRRQAKCVEQDLPREAVFHVVFPDLAEPEVKKPKRKASNIRGGLKGAKS